MRIIACGVCLPLISMEWLFLVEIQQSEQIMDLQLRENERRIVKRVTTN